MNQNTDTLFLAGAGIADLTPPLNVGILMSSAERRWAPFQGVRMPICARALVMRGETQTVALVSLDLLGIAGAAFGGMAAIKHRIAAASGQSVRPDDMILACTHTHSSPETIALTDLHRTMLFKNWTSQLVGGVGAAIRQAIAALRPCRFLIGTTTAPGLGIHRRIKTTQGILMSHPEPPPEIVISREGPVDESVHVAACVDERELPIAIVVNASCHPVHEMCIPQISGDYPGELSKELERTFPGAIAMFLNGAAGNINPPTVSSGPTAAAEHGRCLAQRVRDVFGRLQGTEGNALILRRRNVSLPARTSAGRPAPRPLVATLTALRMGDAAFVFLPGEPFVEFGLDIRAKSPFQFTSVTGYAEDYIGYLPTDQAFREGGYEAGPGRWSRLRPGSGQTVTNNVICLLREFSEQHTRD